MTMLAIDAIIGALFMPLGLITAVWQGAAADAGASACWAASCRSTSSPGSSAGSRPP
jgi:hypothetical protein